MITKRSSALAAAILAVALSSPAAAETTTSSVARGRPRPPAERLSLAEALQRALQRNPSVVQAFADVRRSEALVREVRAASLPQLSGNAVYTRLDDDRKRGAITISPKEQASANVQLGLVLAPVQWANWSHASDAVDVSRASSDEVRRQVAIGVARAFISVLSQHQLVSSAERARDTARAHYEFARTRLSGGVGNKLDEIRAAQELAVDEAQVQASYANLTRAEEALGVLVAGDRAVDADETVPLPAAPKLDEALASVKTRRTDVHALEVRLAAAKRAYEDRWVYYLPTLAALFQPGYQDTTNPTTGWQAQLVLSLPLYDGGLRYGVAEERKALVEDAESRVDAAYRQASSEIRTAFEVLLRADLSLDSSRSAAKLSKEALELANLAYRAGATTNLEVIDAERRARDADTSAAIAEDAARQARLDLLAASGAYP